MTTTSGCTMMNRRISLMVLVICALAARSATAAEPPAIEPFLREGRLADGEAMLLTKLQDQPNNSEAKLSLGVVRSLMAIERLGQNLYRHGSRPRNFFALNLLGGPGGSLPILRMPVPPNPNPEPINYARFREIIAEFLSGLEKAESTLAAVNDPELRLPLNFGRICLDLDGNGTCDAGEELWRVYGAVIGRTRASTTAFRDLTIALDQADAHWLRGYCHLLSGICEIILAYDESELFNRCASMVFPKVDSPVELVAGNGDIIQMILDEVAAIHLASFPILHPERTIKAHRHFKGMIQQSRAMWVAIEAETDNDREWIPGQRQTSAVLGVRMNKEMIAGWKEFLSEAEDVLDGKKLIPFWRGEKKNLGVNLRRVFHEPRNLDLILWTGPAAIPYLEVGELTEPSVWERFNRIFRGNFIGFAIWIN